MPGVRDAGMKRSFINDVLGSVAGRDPWSWISIMFGLQAAASMILTKFLPIAVEKTFVPILILVSAAVVSFRLRHKSGASHPDARERWIPVAFYMAFIFFLSHTSSFGNKTPVNADFFHPIEYAFLGILLCWAWRRVLLRGDFPSFASRVVLAGTGYGMLDEIHQYFVPGRNSSLSDLFLDFAGVCLGLAAFMLLRRLRTGFAGPAGSGPGNQD